MLTDEVLARTIQQGDMDALDSLVRRHHSPLIGYLYRMTGGDRQLAEDLTQETFLRALRAIDRYAYPKSFKAWLYAIATNLARDHFKRAETRHTVDEAPPESTAQTSDNRIEMALIADDETIAVIDGLMRMPDHQREVVVLRYYQELSLAEIAEALNIPVGTVKSRLSLGLKRLRAVLEEGDA